MKNHFKFHILSSKIHAITYDDALVFCRGIYLGKYHTEVIILVLWLGMSRSGFFYPHPNPSPLIFSICRYRVPIWYLALTNIYLDNTAALRKKVPAPKLFLNRFFYFVETKSILSYGSFLFCICYSNIVLHLPCVSRWVCDAALWQQTLVTADEVWETQLTLGTISSFAFFIFFTLSHKMTWTHCLSISNAFSTSTACFTCSAVWDRRNWWTYGTL